MAKLSFTDKDLKRWKSVRNTPKMDALIYRLECAEAVLLEIQRFNGGILANTAEFKVWLRSKGE